MGLPDMQIDPNIKPGTPGAAPKVPSISQDILPDQTGKDWFSALAEIGALDQRLRDLGHKISILSSQCSGSASVPGTNANYSKQWMALGRDMLAWSPQDPKNDQDETESLTYNGVTRYSLLLYCNLHHRGPENLSSQKVATQLKFELINLNARFNRNHFIFLTWILYVGGTHAEKAERKWWIDQIRSTSGFSATTWRATRLRLQQVLWNENVCEEHFHALWKDTDASP